MFHSEQKLIKKIKKGNQKAFQKLYNNYANYALRTAYIITNSNDHAADIVQETFIKVFRNIHQYDFSKPFKPWFYQILLNESRRYMAKQNKQPITLDSEQLLNYYENTSVEAVDYSNIEIALDQLSEMHRTVLVLKYLNDFTEKEIATMLQLNINTVKSRLYKARQKLRTIIGGERNERK